MDRHRAGHGSRHHRRRGRRERKLDLDDCPSLNRTTLNSRNRKPSRGCRHVGAGRHGGRRMNVGSIRLLRPRVEFWFARGLLRVWRQRRHRWTRRQRHGELAGTGPTDEVSQRFRRDKCCSGHRCRCRSRASGHEQGGQRRATHSREMRDVLSRKALLKGRTSQVTSE